MGTVEHDSFEGGIYRPKKRDVFAHLVLGIPGVSGSAPQEDLGPSRVFAGLEFGRDIARENNDPGCWGGSSQTRAVRHRTTLGKATVDDFCVCGVCPRYTLNYGVDISQVIQDQVLTVFRGHPAADDSASFSFIEPMEGRD